MFLIQDCALASAKCYETRTTFIDRLIEAQSPVVGLYTARNTDSSLSYHITLRAQTIRDYWPYRCLYSYYGFYDKIIPFSATANC